MIMNKPTCCFLALLTAFIIAPASAQAQRKEAAEDFVKDVVGSLFGPNWNVSVHGGTANHGRFMLQRAAGGDGSEERALQGDGGFNVGIGAGVDILLRTGLRLGYTYSESDLAFRTDDGDGSSGLDVDDVAKLLTHSATFEIIRYLLPSQATLTPYASVGVAGVWYNLNDVATALRTSDDTQFRTAGLASVGFKVKVTDHVAVRMEGASSSVRNPFSGHDSYRIASGVTVDEPARVSQRELRFIAVYNFGKPDMPDLPRARR
jgi:hypothetical protein